jgi:hypothetical protein
MYYYIFILGTVLIICYNINIILINLESILTRMLIYSRIILYNSIDNN